MCYIFTDIWDLFRNFLMMLPENNATILMFDKFDQNLNVFNVINETMRAVLKCGVIWYDLFRYARWVLLRFRWCFNFPDFLLCVCVFFWYCEQTCEWNGLWMRNASLRPLAACENTTKAGDGKCVDPYSDPSIVK